MPFLPPSQQCQSTEGKQNAQSKVKFCTDEHIIGSLSFVKFLPYTVKGVGVRA